MGRKKEVCKKEETKCNNIIKRYKNDKFYNKKHKRT